MGGSHVRAEAEEGMIQLKTRMPGLPELEKAGKILP